MKSTFHSLLSLTILIGAMLVSSQVTDDYYAERSNSVDADLAAREPIFWMIPSLISKIAGKRDLNPHEEALLTREIARSLRSRSASTSAGPDIAAREPIFWMIPSLISKIAGKRGLDPEEALLTRDVARHLRARSVSTPAEEMELLGRFIDVASKRYGELERRHVGQWDDLD